MQTNRQNSHQTCWLAGFKIENQENNCTHMFICVFVCVAKKLINTYKKVYNRTTDQIKEIKTQDSHLKPQKALPNFVCMCVR